MKTLNFSHLDGVTGGRYFAAWPGSEDQPKGWFTHTCPTAKAVKKFADKGPFLGWTIAAMKGAQEKKMTFDTAVIAVVSTLGYAFGMAIDDNIDDFYDYYGWPKE